MKRPNKRHTLRCERLESRRLLAAVLDIQNPDIPGGSGFAGHVDEIVVDSFHLSLSDATPGAAGGLQVQDFRVLKQFDKGTPALIRESTIGKSHETVSFNVLDANGNDVLTIDLDDSRLTGFATADDESNNSKVFEDLALSYAGIKIGFNELDTKTGNVTSKRDAQWDLLTNKSKTAAGTGLVTTPLAGGAFLTIAGKNIAIEQFDWRAALPVSFFGENTFIGDALGGDFAVTRKVDLTTPAIFSSLVSEQSLGESIKLSDQRSVNGTDVTNVEWTIYNPFITTFDLAGGSDLTTIRNSFFVSYSKVDFKVTPITGKFIGTPTSVSWDLAQNTVTSASGFGNNKVTGTGNTILTLPNGGAQ